MCTIGGCFSSSYLDKRAMASTERERQPLMGFHLVNCKLPNNCEKTITEEYVPTSAGRLQVQLPLKPWQQQTEVVNKIDHYMVSTMSGRLGAI